MIQHGQYAFYNLEHGQPRAVLLSSKSLALQLLLGEANDRQQIENMSVLEKTAREALKALDVLIAVDTDYEFDWVWHFRELLNDDIKRLPK